MKKQIIIAGDSNTFGLGCSDRLFYYDIQLNQWIGDIAQLSNGPSNFCWASLLQKKFPEIEILNLGVPANDNLSIATSIANNITDNTIMVMFNGTFLDRIQVASPRNNIVKSWIIKQDPRIGSGYNDPEQYKNAKLAYIQHLYHDTIGINLGISSIFSAYGLATCCNAAFRWSMPTLTLDKHLSNFEQYRIPAFNTNYDFSGINDLNFNNTMIAEDKGHPNEAGHKIYFEREIVNLVTEILDTVK